MRLDCGCGYHFDTDERPTGWSPADLAILALNLKIKKNKSKEELKIKKQGKHFSIEQQRKLPSIKSQIIRNLKDQLNNGMGTSKHMDKQDGMKKGLAQNEMYRGKIYSVKTFQNYRNLNMQAVEWMRSQNMQLKNLADFRQNMPSYLKFLKENQYSAWTIRSHAAAAAKIFGVSSKDFGVDLPSRRAEERVNNRTEKMSKNLSKIEGDTLEFARLTGLRRREMEAFKKSNHKDFLAGETDLLHLDGKKDNTKGHRDRTVVLTREDAQKVRYLLENSPKFKHLDRPFTQLSKKLQLHLQRHYFANATYSRILQERIDHGTAYTNLYRRKDGSGRVYDRDALQAVSEALGHSRVDTSIVSYLD